MDNVHFDNLYNNTSNSSSATVVPQFVKSDPSLFKDDVDIRFDKINNYLSKLSTKVSPPNRDTTQVQPHPEQLQGSPDPLRHARAAAAEAHRPQVPLHRLPQYLPPHLQGLRRRGPGLVYTPDTIVRTQ